MLIFAEIQNMLQCSPHYNTPRHNKDLDHIVRIDSLRPSQHIFSSRVKLSTKEPLGSLSPRYNKPHYNKNLDHIVCLI